MKLEETKDREQKRKFFLGVDGGQSHTEALVADEFGNILGRGFGGASNHAEIPGGRERLENAIRDSVGRALQKANLPSLEAANFASAHCGMTGGADYKLEIIESLISANNLVVGHDAPTALFGATGGEPGVVVIAGTGSVVYGENGLGDTAQLGGLGFLFSDEGSGFWLAAQTIRLAIKEQDGLLADSGLQEIVKNFFGVKRIRELTTGFYNNKVSRDEIAALAKTAAEKAADGHNLLSEQVRYGAQILIESVKVVSEKLNLTGSFPVGGVGGMFRGELMRKFFTEALAEKVAQAHFIDSKFGPAAGALLLAYRNAEISLTTEVLSNLESSLKL